ncbi:DUF6684 family protein [Halobacterium jilantaiense]|uniref:Cox cluster protein n=1 Tax=Halobacterium jilantaiense TaxID=355548 RepID=A0A1I0NEU9_9EURY|nr:DUF6684 family protein [Halobacterium jilantaiense]SEV99949.1 hypothetical protein SAMN04487945_0826 [Halobacterium jilantaiense]
MSSGIFDKDTMLDLTVNIVPLAILGFFFAAFLLLNPWGGGITLERGLQFVLVGWMFVGLAILTYVAAVKIEGGE